MGADIGLALAVILSLKLVARTLEGNVMPFESTPYPWGRDSVVENAPHRSGIYGLYSALWIYIGEADGPWRASDETLRWRQSLHREIRSEPFRVRID